jgi:hypothetical protein
MHLVLRRKAGCGVQMGVLAMQLVRIICSALFAGSPYEVEGGCDIRRNVTPPPHIPTRTQTQTHAVWLSLRNVD